MDKLQAAIEMARATRAGKQGPVSPDSRDSLWAATREMELDERELNRNRLIAYAGGSQGVSYDLLRTRMINQATQKNWRRIGIISPTASCGKTTAVANLAFALGRQPEIRAIVLDLDLRRPRLGSALGQKMEHSMEDVLEQRIPFSQHARRYQDNVLFGLNKSAATAPSELLQSNRTREVIAQIETDFKPDLLLVDLPPMLVTDDNFGFLKNVDAVMVVAAAEETRLDHVDVTLRQVAELTNVMGIVLNKCRYVHGAYGYGSGYYYYYK